MARRACGSQFERRFRAREIEHHWRQFLGLTLALAALAGTSEADGEPAAVEKVTPPATPEPDVTPAAIAEHRAKQAEAKRVALEKQLENAKRQAEARRRAREAQASGGTPPQGGDVVQTLPADATATEAEPPPETPSTAPSALEFSEWRERWSVNVGSTQGDRTFIGLGQIALRGSMIVVASRGVPGKNDALDGVHILNGSAEPASASARQVRKIASPAGPAGSAEGGTDAIGVAIDGDFVVFGTYAGVVTKARLDGLSSWQFSDWPKGTRPGLPALIDVDGDGTRDAVLPVIPLGACAIAGAKDCDAAWEVLTIAVDGKSGREIWRILRKDAEALRDCVDTLIENGKDALRVACQEAQNYRSAAFGLDGKAASEIPPDDFDLRQLTSRMLSTLINRWPAGTGTVQSMPSLGDIDLDGEWDAVLVVDGKLTAFTIPHDEENNIWLWRGNIAATGVQSLADNPQAYASRVEPRDVARWLEVDRAPGEQGACSVVPTSELARAYSRAGAFVREPAELPRPTDPSQPSVHAELVCQNRYALNEGHLIIRKDASWLRVPGAPWPITALGCSGSLLLLEQPDGKLLEMKVPKSWELEALGLLIGIVTSALLVGWFAARKTQDRSMDQGEGKASRAQRRTIVLNDVPRSNPKDAHPDQARLIDGLMNVLDNADTRPPVTIALYGPWGSGKSSIMQMLRSELADTGRYIDVWFNAWRFQREKELAPALLQSIVDAVGKQSDWVTRVSVLWHRVRTASAREVLLFLVLLSAGLLLLAISFRATAGSTAQTVLSGTVGTLVSILVLMAGAAHRVFGPLIKVFSVEPAKLLATGNSKRRIQFVSAFASEFEQISKRLPRGTRLIVFIDDLDRCAPERVVNVLETLSMLADTGCGFFVMAVDPVSVKRAVELTYKEVLSVMRVDSPAEAKDFGARYLEKMVTLGVNVPPIPSADAEPDKRVSKLPELGVGEWLATRVLPEWPLRLAIVGALLVGTLAARSPETVNTLLDAGAHLLFAPAAPASPAPEKTAPPADARPASEDQPAPTPANPAATSEGTSAQPAATPAVARGAVTLGERSAFGNVEILPPVKAPGEFTAEATETPAAARRASEQIAYGVQALGVLALLAIGAVFLAEVRRRRRLERTRSPGEDSEEFSKAMKKSRSALPANPRNAVRFTNLCRFLYPVVASSTKIEVHQWQGEFFSGLRRRWLGEADLEVSPWIEAEIDRWIPSDAQRPQPESGPRRTEQPPSASKS